MMTEPGKGFGEGYCVVKKEFYVDLNTQAAMWLVRIVPSSIWLYAVLYFNLFCLLNI